MPAGTTDGDGVVLDVVAIGALAHGFGLDGLALAGDANHIPGQAGHFVLTVLAHHADAVAHVLLGEVLPAADEGQQALHRAGGFIHGLGVIPGDFQLRIAHHQCHAEFLFNQPDVLVEAPKEGFGLLQSV